MPGIRPISVTGNIPPVLNSEQFSNSLRNHSCVMSDHAKGNWTFTRGHFISRDLSISSTWYLIRAQEDRTCILIPTGKVAIENKVLGDKTGEGNSRTKSSPVMFVKYPSVRYILPRCSINKCQTSSVTHSVMKCPLLTAVLLPGTGLPQWAHGKVIRSQHYLRVYYCTF
uniref:Uncharacterized protein n=1 Tax=Pipistrellus kuhlii TaxID=59472 RepID=A0A7J7Y9H9_PIPKU|nr:hypothetical protein mPipKuh1_010357 [Pipistrellus kuhlii]